MLNNDSEHISFDCEFMMNATFIGHCLHLLRADYILLTQNDDHFHDWTDPQQQVHYAAIQIHAVQKIIIILNFHKA